MGSKMPETDRLDEVRIREFLAADYPRLVAAVRLVAGGTAPAEDAVAEALARAWERSERGETIVNLPAWVLRAALNLATSRWRRLRSERRAGERVAHASDEGPPGSDDRLDIERALTDLSPRECQVTVLRYYLGFDVAETAVILRVSEGTVKTLLFRARRRLAAALGEHVLEEGDDRAELR
jgi:RNA polymerase sigma-70 factor (ECF subfamily)